MRTVRKTRWTRLAMAVAVLAAAACRPAADDAAVENSSRNSVLPLPPLPVAEPPMNREALLLAVARAASATALGKDDAADQRKLDGKRFEVRIRFGCDLAERAAAPSERFSVRFDEKNRTLRVRAAPDLGLDDAPIAALASTGGTVVRSRPVDDETTGGKKAGKAAASETIEAVEGFWLRRPWLLADGCPVTAPDVQEAFVPPQDAGKAGADEKSAAKPDGVGEQTARIEAAVSTNERVGIAQFFTRADARTGRRDSRAYETTKVLGDDQQPSADGYNLVLSGRLRAQPLGRVISCTLASASVPPHCVVSAEFGRVWIERPDSGDVVAEWGSQ